MNKISIDNLTLPIGSCRLERSESGAQVILENGKAFSITLPESCILQKLFESSGEVISKHDLIVAAWGAPEIIGANSLPVAITNLRKILEISNIKITNVPRKGYKIDIPEAERQTSSIQPLNDEELPTPQAGGLDKMKAFGALCSLLFFAYVTLYVAFSWVTVDCQPIGQATVCSIRGEQPTAKQVELIEGKQGSYYYSSQWGFMEVSDDIR